MTDADAEKIGIAVARALQGARSVSDSEHYDHHRWITERIKQAEASRQFWEEMRRHVVKWGLIGALTGLGTALVVAFRAWVKAG